MTGCAFTANAEVQLIHGTMVLLQSVPSELCNVAMMEVVLQQAQIDASIITCWTEDVGPFGEVTLALESQAAAEVCISHFQGCQWGVQGTRLVARLADLTEESAATIGVAHFEMESVIQEYGMEVQRNVERLLCALLEPCEAAVCRTDAKKGRFGFTAASTETCWHHWPRVPEVCFEGFAKQETTCMSALEIGSEAAWVLPSLEKCSQGAIVEMPTGRADESHRSAAFVTASEKRAVEECSESVSTEEGTGAGTSEAEFSDFPVGLSPHYRSAQAV